MFNKTSFLAILIIGSSFISQAQLFDIEEKNAVVQNGFEYGYLIKNEQVKNVKSAEYNRFEITLYISNKSGCTKLYADRQKSLSNDDPNLFSTFTCNNANGKRLTAKSATIKVNTFYVDVKQTVNGKETYSSVKAGYIFRNGETLKTNIIVLVPKDERPKIQCMVNYLPELQ